MKKLWLLIKTEYQYKGAIDAFVCIITKEIPSTLTELAKLQKNTVALRKSLKLNMCGESPLHEESDLC